MYHLRRNKNELLVLTGAVYSFVAYLTAFALEVLFLIDTGRRNGEILSTLAAASNAAPTQNDSLKPFEILNLIPRAATPSTGGIATLTREPALNPQEPVQAHLFDRFSLESMQAHVTVACLSVSILYFVIFITSLLLIVALILRSTFMLLTWLCAMTTIYLPEFGMVLYMAVYNWGLNTRNGQTELAFYLCRAALNLVFIFRAHKLYKQWSYEKNFFRLKSGSASSSLGGFGSNHSPYDSAYFIGSNCATGETLSTTINPIFSTSTLNLNRYDFVRDQFNQYHDKQQERRQQHSQRDSTLDSRERSAVYGPSGTTSPHTNDTSLYGGASIVTTLGGDSMGRASNQLRLQPSYLEQRELNTRWSVPGETAFRESPGAKHKQQVSRFHWGVDDLGTTQTSSFRVTSDPSSELHRQPENQQPSNRHRLSAFSISDEHADYELDLEYRTLSKLKGANKPPTTMRAPQISLENGHDLHSNNPSTTGQMLHRHINGSVISDDRNQAAKSAIGGPDRSMISHSQDDLAYSTQSLDRRALRDFALTEQVILRPLGHQPFEYLNRPGSTTNLKNSKWQ